MSDPDAGDGDDDEWRYSLEDLEDGEGAGSESEGAGSEATEPSESASGDTGAASSAATEPSESASGDTGAASSVATEPSESASGDTGAGEKGESDDADDGEGLDAGVAGTMDIDEKLEAGDISRENAIFVLVGVLLALAFLAGFLNLI